MAKKKAKKKPSKKKKPTVRRDVNQIAAQIVRQATESPD
jgi:hypothetical protein